MRRFILSICLFFIVIAASAQTLTPSTGGESYLPVATGIDYVFIFNGLDNASINYNGSLTGVKWYKSTDPLKYTGEQSDYDNLVDGTGYIFEDAKGNKKTFWVIDYSQHKPILTSIAFQDNANSCSFVNLLINTNAPTLTYQTITGVIKTVTIPQNFDIKYTTLKWDDASSKWQQQPKDTMLTLNSPTTQVSVPAPYCSTTFTLSGDQFATDFGISVSVPSTTYTPVAVICHETSVVQTRDATNENQRPTTAKQVTGSAPLDMIFYSNPNDPVTYYHWQIFKDKATSSLIDRTGEKTTPYTFTEPGSYVVKVTVSNDKACSFSDSITVTVSTSSIVAPNVFTPNGDGNNDEFRVAYKSILTFHCWVYNRWGRLVYEWTDPMKGWDGNINGKEASPGPYYYVIKATGNDGQKYKLKGDINLLR